MVTLELPRYYGLAVIDVMLHSLLLVWKGFQVMKARKKYGVKYPTMYEDKADSEFNRYQRAHANSLEFAPVFLPMLLLSALGTPLLSGVAGLFFVLGRYLYATGYYASVRSRVQGAKFYAPAIVYLAFGTLYVAAKLLY